LIGLASGGAGASTAFALSLPGRISLPAARAGGEAWMLNPLIRTLVKVAVASLIVGTILSHFGITAEQLIKEFGLSYERVETMARRGLSWAAPNLLVGAMVILPVWFLLYLFRPPGGSGQKQD
jgi:hypothetical protein